MEIKAIEEIPDILSNKKEVQRLTGRITALGRFISRSSQKCFKFFSALKKQDHFEWNEECQHALRNLKTYLSNPPLLAKPKAREKLLIYCYFGSGGKRCFGPRRTSQGMQLEEEKELQVFNGANPGTWTLFTNGSSHVKGAGLGVVLVPPMGETIRQAIKCHSIIDNEAEYEAMIAGLELARELCINQIIIKSDSQLVVNQMLGTYTAREARKEQYLEKADVANDANASVIHLFHSILDPDVNEYGTIPDDKKKAYALRRKATRYCLKQGNLYRKMFGGPLARCLGPSQTECEKRKSEILFGGISYVDSAYTRVFNERNTRETLRESRRWKITVGNGQAKSTNKVIINNLKKRLEESKGNWPEVLLGVLWAYRTMAKTSTGETPFSLVYRTEALIPVEIGEPSTRFTQATQESNDEEMRVNLDLLETRREAALIRMAA
ncbi:uncharacterized protein [Nicotiana sylvestris]|uniref:uncharacterized protein n=1 Tax=Nicotiana sylvestris TaxID=4096 RepID=UPI00388C9B4E